jgi:hypothetical protein
VYVLKPEKRVTYHLLSLDCLVAAAHAGYLARGRISDNLVNLLIKHVGAAVDSTQTGKGLRELAETVERIDVGGFAVTRHRGSVENDAVDGGASGFGDVATGWLVQQANQMDNTELTRHQGGAP